MIQYQKVIALVAVCLTLISFSAFADDQDGTEGISQVPPAAEEKDSIDTVMICLNFDDLAVGTLLTTYGGVTFTNTHGNLPVGSNYPGPVFSAPNSVIPAGYTNVGNRTRARFPSPVSYVSVTMGDFNADADDLYLRAYNASNVLVDSDFTTIPSTLNGGVNLSVSAPDIAYVEFYGIGLNNNSVFFDNLCFESQDCDYCLTDTAGYNWCLNIISIDSRAYYLAGTCDTGTTPLKDAHATYLYSTKGLTATAYGGASGMIFSSNTKFISDTYAQGVRVSSNGWTGYRDMWLIDCGSAVDSEVIDTAEDE